jgi:argonaute-like protein implicated in RNA metabolism and viral defense
MNDTEAFLVSSLPPFGDATPQPLQVRVHGGITIEQACHSILALTLVHIGSKLAPRPPVTVHFADQIAELALKNIKPRSLEGDLPFWL